MKYEAVCFNKNVGYIAFEKDVSSNAFGGFDH